MQKVSSYSCFGMHCLAEISAAIVMTKLGKTCKPQMQLSEGQFMNNS